jgi:hypothetical protein
MPLATACRCHTAGIERLGNLTQRGRPGLLCLANDGQDVRAYPHAPFV